MATRPLSGVRSSWLTITRNSSFALLAAWASSIARRSCSLVETSSAVRSATFCSSASFERSSSVLTSRSFSSARRRATWVETRNRATAKSTGLVM